MSFHPRQRKIDDFIPNIRINDSSIGRIIDYNFLGFQIDEHLNWNAQIQKKVLIKSLVLCESWIIWNDIYHQKSFMFIQLVNSTSFPMWNLKLWIQVFPIK